MTARKMLAPFWGPIATVLSIVALMAFFLWLPHARAADGCVEIHFPTRAGDIAVRFPILAPVGFSDDIVKDACTAIKRAGDADFGPWRNDFCEKAETPQWVCDFSHIESDSVTGRKVVLMGSFAVTQPGEHVLRLPAYFADESKGYVTTLALIRGGEDSYPPAPPVGADFKEGYAYGSLRRNWLVRHSTDAMGVRWFDYYLSTRRASFFYTREEAEASRWATRLYFPAWGESPLSN